MVALPFPTPLADPAHRRQGGASSTSYVTVNTAVVLTNSVNIDGTELPLDGQATNSAPAGGEAFTSAPTFEGVGGTLNQATITQTSFLATPTNAASSETSTPAATASSSGGSISLGAVVAAFVVFGVLSLCLTLFFCFKRRKAKKAIAHQREMRRIRSDEPKSFIGGHGYPDNREGPWEQFTTNGSDSDHVPGFLPSPKSIPRDMYSESNQSHLLTKLNYSTDTHRRQSIKSTVTGKVNPSNNFADTVEDEYEDAKSARYPASPVSAAPFGTQARPPKFEPEESQVSYRSDEGGEITFPPANSSVRESPIPQQTPVPTRTLTLKSHRGNGTSQNGHDDKSPGKTKNLALTNLIAALDTQEEHRRSMESHRTHLSPMGHLQHVLVSPSDLEPSRNPFE